MKTRHEKNLSATLRVRSNSSGERYDPMIFGGFLEHFDTQIYGGVYEPGSPLADDDGFRLDVIDAIRELRTPIIRWPGGCFVDSYHWIKGVGPQREAYGEFRWGVMEPNTFGTHEFVEFCRRIGAEPYICFNGLASPQENLDWVLYCNATEGELAELRKANGHPESLNVRYWSVGNERSDRPYIDRVRETAQKMKDMDPELVIMCSGAHGGSHPVVNEYLFETAATHLDLISIHNYWLDRGKELLRYDYLTAIGKSEMPEKYISDCIKALQDKGQLSELSISFDEWNLRAWQHPGFPRNEVADYEAPETRSLVEQRVRENDLAEQYTMADALFSASFLNACLRHAKEVTMACIAPLVNTRGPLFVHPDGIVKRTHFHTMAMYANLLGSRVVPLEVSSPDLSIGNEHVVTLDAIATVDDRGEEWSIALVNRHPSEALECTLSLPSGELNGSFKATQLNGDSPEAYNSLEQPDRVVPRDIEVVFKNGVTSLPPHSLTIVKA
mgnify:CR=1 FL=1